MKNHRLISKQGTLLTSSDCVDLFPWHRCLWKSCAREHTWRLAVHDLLLPNRGPIYSGKAVRFEVQRGCMDLLWQWDQSNMLRSIHPLCRAAEKTAVGDGGGLLPGLLWHSHYSHPTLRWEGIGRHSRWEGSWKKTVYSWEPINWPGSVTIFCRKSPSSRPY